MKTVTRFLLCAAALLLASCSQSPVEEAALPSDQTTVAPETRANMTFTDGSFKLEFFDYPDAVFSGKKLSFRIYLDEYGLRYDDDVTVEIVDMSDDQPLAVTFDRGMAFFSFWMGNEPGCRIRVTSKWDPTVTSEFDIRAMQGVFLKMVELERHYYDEAQTLEVAGHGIQFFADKACTQRINAPANMTIHVLLHKKAKELFPTATLLYRDEVVYVGAGWEDTCNYRLTTVHQTLPSGEVLNDYYDIEFLEFIRY